MKDSRSYVCVYISYDPSHNEVSKLDPFSKGSNLYSLHWFPFDFKENVNGEEKCVKLKPVESVSYIRFVYCCVFKQ